MKCAQCGGETDGSAKCAQCGVSSGGAGGFTFHPERWPQADKTSGLGTLALLISLFMPWNGLRIFGAEETFDAFASHGYMVILTYLTVLHGIQRPPFRTALTHRQLLLGTTGCNFLLVLAAVIDRPTFTDWRAGALVGLASAAVAIAPSASAILGKRQ